jgi:polar amino acid transport system substrate-binding protein
MRARQEKEGHTMRTRIFSRRRLLATACSVSVLAALAGCSAVVQDDPAVAATGQENPLGLPQRVLDKGALVVATGESTVPTHFKDENGELVGFNIDIAEELEKELGVEVELVVVPFDSLLGGIASQRYDTGLYNVSDRPDRREVVDFVDYANSGSVVVTRKGESLGIDGDPLSMCGHPVGVTSGVNEYTLLTAESEKCAGQGQEPIQLETFANDVSTTQALMGGRVAAMVDGMTATPYLVREHEDQLELAGTLEGDDAPLGMPIAKGQPELAGALQQAWQNILDDGRYERLAEEWATEQLVPDEIMINAGEGL